MQIRWMSHAASDLTTICDYLAVHESAEFAQRVARSIYTRIDSLSRFPHMGRPGREPDTRELVIQRYPYVVIYVLSDVITILRVLHTSQKWP